MKYAKEIIGLMRPYAGKSFRMAQLVCHVTEGKGLAATEAETIRKGVRRVLGHLIEAGLVDRLGGDTKSATYSWRVLGHELLAKACSLEGRLR